MYTTEISTKLSTIISQYQNKSQPLAKYHIDTFIKFNWEKINVTVLLQVA